jgi:hypothetical protein
MVGADVKQIAGNRLDRRVLSMGMAALIAFFGVSASSILPLSAQVVTTLTPTQASDITAPMVTGIHTAGTDATAVESVISATTTSSAQSYPTAPASVLQAIVSASEIAGAAQNAVGGGVGQAIVLLAGNPATASLAVALAAAAPSVMNAAELAAFNAATAAVTINGQTLAAAVAALGTQAQQITAAIPGTAANTNGFGAGGLPPGTGSAGAAGCIPTTSVTHC